MAVRSVLILRILVLVAGSGSSRGKHGSRFARYGLGAPCRPSRLHVQPVRLRVIWALAAVVKSGACELASS
jgi:hypothetical protein